MYLVKKNFICCLDGVGGWITKGIDSGIMTKQIVKHIDDIYQEGIYTDLKNILDLAVKRVTVGGSTTCVMAYIPEESTTSTPILRTCNLGDSGYLLLRPSNDKETEILFKSESQQHYFNCPYQTGIHEKYVWPTKAWQGQHKVRQNDIIVMGSDGVWDNIFNQDIQSCVNYHLKRDGELKSVEDVSKCISTLAEAKSYDAPAPHADVGHKNLPCLPKL